MERQVLPADRLLLKMEMLQVVMEVQETVQAEMAPEVQETVQEEVAPEVQEMVP